MLRGGLHVAGFYGSGEVQAQLLCRTGEEAEIKATFLGHPVNMEPHGGKQTSERENSPVSGREAERYCCVAPLVSFCLPSVSTVFMFATVRRGQDTFQRRDNATLSSTRAALNSAVRAVKNRMQ